MGQNEVILQIKDICKQFGALKAVDGVSLDIYDGEMHAIIGTNGAGKSTLMDLICQRTKPTSGQVILMGKDISKYPPYKIADMGMNKCFQVSKLFGRLTAAENVRMALIKKRGKVYGFMPQDPDFLRDEAVRVLDSVGLAEAADETAALMSYGDQRRLEIAITLALEPRILILDEPTAGVARAEGYEIMKMIRQLAQDKHMTVIFIDHDMEIVFNYADRISVMINGKLIATGTPQEVENNEFVQSAYIGGEE